MSDSMHQGMEGRRCVHCGSPVNEVYVQYSAGNIRLTKCGECKRVADEYAECEMMIILIDLILHKPEVYRHLFFNYPNLNKLDMKDLIWKASLLFLSLDSCKQSILGAGKVDAVKFHSLPTFLFSAGKLVAAVMIRDIVYISTILMAAKFVQRRDSYTGVKWTDLLLSLLLSSYFKFFTFAMMVWDFSPFMVNIAEIFVLSSNTVALKVMLNTSTLVAASIVVAAALANVFLNTLVGAIHIILTLLLV